MVRTLLGERVRSARIAREWSQARLAETSGLSLRYVGQLEGGEANVSLDRLGQVAQALEVSLTSLLAGLGPVHDLVDQIAMGVRDLPHEEQRDLAESIRRRPNKVCLIGLRGAGKSTIGRLVAEQWGCPFVALDEEVSHQAGMTLAELFEFHGEAHFRDLCVLALERLMVSPLSSIVEVGGSVVLNPKAWDLLKKHSHIIWLQAKPEEHLSRVTAQGDLRPMEGRSDALGEIQTILESRNPLYARADEHVDTTRGLQEAVQAVLTSCQSLDSSS
jgi:XRE family aerobic/anaerobic benzoate catabolism transcriptional regulator